jgi:hypothetical protein
VVQSDDFYSEERSELLRELERGTVLYLTKNYYQSLQSFSRAHAKSDELFTRSLKGKLKSLLAENLDNYYGERYERSLIRFYESLVHYKLYRGGFYEAHRLDNDGKRTLVPKKILTEAERKKHLMSARSILVEWDSLMSSYGADSAGKSTYRADLWAKLWAAFIHEEVGTKEDRQIALQLYRDAKDVLLKNYSAYPSYNEKYKNFNDNFSKFAAMPLDMVRTKFISNTAAAKDVLAFIDSKITKLTENKKDNFTVVLTDNFVSPRKAKKIRVGVPLAALLAAGNNSQDFIRFVRNVLFNLEAAGLPTVEFELPYIEPDREQTPYVLDIFEKNEGISQMWTLPLNLVEPVTDIAVRSLDEKIVSSHAKIIATVTAKYAAAMYSAYKIYLSRNGDNLGKMLALLAYGTASKTIAKTTKADLRQWNSLAARIYIGSIRLEPGEYFSSLNLVDRDIGIGTGTFTIGHSNSEFIDINIP